MKKKTEMMVDRFYYQAGILTLASSVVWIVLSVVNVLQKPPKLDVKPEMTVALDPKLDTATLQTISERVQTKGLEPVVIQVVETPPVSSSSAEVDSSPSPSASGSSEVVTGN